jgi:hypothetical protein
MRILCTFRKNSKDHQKQKIGNNVVSKNSKDHQKIEIIIYDRNIEMLQKCYVRFRKCGKPGLKLIKGEKVII